MTRPDNDGLTHWNPSALSFGVSGPLALPILSGRRVCSLIESARALGVTLFDTAPFYGRGLGESRLGAALAGDAEAAISTKIGTARRWGRWVKDFSREGCERAIEGSLKRLRRERLDLLFLHGPAREHLSDELLNLLESLKKHGTLSAVGVAGRGVEIDEALALFGFDWVMTPVNPLIGAEHATRLERCAERGVRIIAIEPLLGGVLAGPRRLRVRPADAYHIARATVRRPPPASPMGAGEALRWAKGQAGVKSVLTTTTHLGHLQANAAALGLAPH